MTVYVLRTKKGSWYKVGYTAFSVERRLKELQTGCPIELEIFSVIEDGNRQLEKDVQASLSEFSADGGNEWYSATEETITKRLEPFINVVRHISEKSGGDIPDWVFETVNGDIPEIEKEIDKCISQFNSLLENCTNSVSPVVYLNKEKLSVIAEYVEKEKDWDGARELVDAAKKEGVSVWELSKRSFASYFASLSLLRIAHL